jgi:hypothetical protein
MQYSPKLKNAMEEVKEILRKYDIAGVVVLHTPGNSEYLNHLTPTYSCASQASNGNMVFKSAKKHFTDEAERINKLRDTSNMLALLAEPLGICAMNMIEMSEKFDEAHNAEHTDGGHTSHNAQNN